MELKAVSYTVDDRIAVIRLARPERHNAWTGRMHTEYRWALQQANDAAEVGAVVITGEGRAFCVGGDAEALAGHAERGAYDPGTGDELASPGFGVAPEFDAAFAYHFGLAKPVLAAVNGAAAGIGLALACFADVRFIAGDARCTTAHGKLNLPAEYGLSWLLPRLVGLTRANDLLLSSRVFTGDEAAAYGLALEALPADEVLPRTVAYARQLVETVAPESLKQTRRQVYRDLHRDVATAVEDSEGLLRAMMQQPDYREGVKAFLEKRSPNWGRGEEQ